MARKHSFSQMLIVSVGLGYALVASLVGTLSDFGTSNAYAQGFIYPDGTPYIGPPDYSGYTTCQQQYVNGVYTCVNFSNDFSNEATCNGLQAWGVVMGFTLSSAVPSDCQVGHAVNITADCDGQYCVVEPNGGSTYGCWQQNGGGAPQIPYTVQANMFQGFGEPFKSCYNLVAQNHDTSNLIFITVMPQGSPVPSTYSAVPSGLITYNP
jgi:hypothetical protein